MSFIYVVGVAGSGKSAVADSLGRRGVAAYDEDAAGVGAAHNKQSGQAVQIPSAEKRSPDWFDAHEWRILSERLGEFVALR